MVLQQIQKVGAIDPHRFQQDYYKTSTPIVMTDLAKEWPAYKKWNWDYFKEMVGTTSRHL